MALFFAARRFSVYILDRFEGNFALLLSRDGDERLVPREVLGSAKEGDAFRLADDGSFIYDAALTEARKESVRSRFARLVKRK